MPHIVCAYHRLLVQNLTAGLYHCSYQTSPRASHKLHRQLLLRLEYLHVDDCQRFPSIQPVLTQFVSRLFASNLIVPSVLAASDSLPRVSSVVLAHAPPHPDYDSSPTTQHPFLPSIDHTSFSNTLLQRLLPWMFRRYH